MQIAANSRLSGLGLSPGDPCYDPNHPRYLPNFFSDSFECQCMAQNYGDGPGQYNCGQQCVGYGPDSCSVGSVIGSEVGGAAGALLGTAAKTATDTSGTGTWLIVGVGIAAFFLLSTLIERRA